jgi:hypothetical protein
MEITTQHIINGVGLLLGSGVTGYMYRAAIRLEVLERLFDEKRVTLSEVKTNQENMDKRLALVEAAVVGLNEILPEIRKLPATLERVTALLENQDRRVTRIEDNEDEVKK